MKPENGDTWQFAAVPFEAGKSSVTNIQAKAHALLIGHREVHHETLSWVGRSCQAHHLRYASEKQMVEETTEEHWLPSADSDAAVPPLPKLQRNSLFRVNGNTQQPALGVQRPLIGLASENVADDIFHPLTWDNHAKSTSKSEFEKHSHEGLIATHGAIMIVSAD